MGSLSSPVKWGDLSEISPKKTKNAPFLLLNTEVFWVHRMAHALCLMLVMLPRGCSCMFWAHRQLQAFNQQRTVRTSSVWLKQKWRTQRSHISHSSLSLHKTLSLFDAVWLLHLPAFSHFFFSLIPPSTPLSASVTLCPPSTLTSWPSLPPSFFPFVSFSVLFSFLSSNLF